MKKILFIGITIILFSIIFSGCQELGFSVLNPKEVKDNSNKYLGKSIRVEGYFIKEISFINPDAVVSVISHGSEEETREMIESMLPIKYDENITLINGSMYRFTGVLKIYEDEFFGQQHEVCLDVSKAQSI